MHGKFCSFKLNFVICYFLTSVDSQLSCGSVLLQLPSDHSAENILPASEAIPETTIMVSEMLSSFLHFLSITIPTQKTNALVKHRFQVDF